MRATLILMLVVMGFVLFPPAQSAEKILPDNINHIPLKTVPAVAIDPDGRQVAYAVGSRGDGEDLFFHRAELRIFDRTAGTERQMPLPGGVLRMNWSSGGSWIGLLGADTQGGRYFGIVNADGAPELTIAGLERLGFPMEMAWSPDGSQVAVHYLRSRNFGHKPVERKSVLYSSLDGEITPDNSGDIAENISTIVVLSVPDFQVLSQSSSGFLSVVPGSLDWEKQDLLTLLGITFDAQSEAVNALASSLYTMDPVAGSVREVGDVPAPVVGGVRLPAGERRLLCRRPDGLSPYEFAVEAWVLDGERLEPGDDRLCAGSLQRAGDRLFFRRRLASIHLSLVLDSGELRDLIPAGKSVGAYSISRGGDYIAAAIGDANHPEDVYLIDTATGNAERITHLNEEVLDAYAFAEAELLHWPSADGRFMVDGFLLKPPGFTPGRRYPLIVNLHGGPGASYVNAFEDLRFNPARHSEMEAYASAGYLVLMPNPRGGVAGDPDFQNGLKGRVYDSLDQDVYPGIDLLVARGEVDPQRIAIFGASYGALAAAWATTASQRFRVASLNDGNYDHYQQFGMSLTEWAVFYLQADPVRDLRRYMELSPVFHADRVCAPTLLRAGGVQLSELTINAFLPQALRYFHQLRWAGVPVELVIHMTQGHAITSSGFNADFLRLNLLWLDFWMHENESSAAADSPFVTSWRTMRERASDRLGQSCPAYLGPRSNPHAQPPAGGGR